MKPSEYWNDDRTEREFEESGLQCCTRTMDVGHRCGYVALPKSHPLFGKGCTPVNPVGACMVSGEGACSAFYQYGQ